MLSLGVLPDERYVEYVARRATKRRIWICLMGNDNKVLRWIYKLMTLTLKLDNNCLIIDYSTYNKRQVWYRSDGDNMSSSSRWGGVPLKIHF